MAKPLLALGLLVVPACTDSLGMQSQSIIGGESANPMDFRTVVALEEAPGKWFCTGTLIADRWVLTAAHCVDGAAPTGIHVRFDAADANMASTGTVADVAAVHSNPAFDWMAWDNDIALLQLAQPITDRTPTPISRDPVAFGTQVIDVGYGVADNMDGGGGLLRKVDKVTADCAGANDPTVSGANLICMDASDGRGSCFGDSGGPTFARINNALTVVGVTSGGTGDLCGAGWDLYTSVHAELAFVDSVMNAAPPPPPEPEPEPEPEPTPEPTPEPVDDDGGGCSAAGSGSGGWLAFLVLWRRRRRGLTMS